MKAVKSISICDEMTIPYYVSILTKLSFLDRLLSRYSESPSWRSFFNFPRRFINASLTVLCIKYAMDTKTLTGVNTGE